MPTSRVLAACCILAALLQVGCSAPTSRTETTAFTTVGPVELDIELFSGDVYVTVRPGIRESKVSIIREATHGRDREDDATASLDDIITHTELLGGDFGQRLVVRSSTLHQEPHFQRTSVFVDAQAIEHVRVKTNYGNVQLHGVSGAIDISTSRGHVRVMTTAPLRESVRIVNTMGDIEYRARPESTGEFDCAVINGKIEHRIASGHVRVHNGTGQDAFLATLNSGQNPVYLRTTDGNIFVNVLPSPMQVPGAQVAAPHELLWPRDSSAP